jgi:hypothetical protein
MKRIQCSVLIFLGLLSGCYSVPENLEPQISYSVQDTYLKRLPSPFPPLTIAEKKEDWGKEYQIGLHFAHQLDLYQALTAFKRAEILIPKEDASRKLEISYEILLCYYLGNKYSEVIQTFETSDLQFVDTSFPACHDLLVILYESYDKVDNQEKKERTGRLIEQYYPKTEEKLTISSALIHGNIQTVGTLSKIHPEETYLSDLIRDYDKQKKSIKKAQGLNALLPGSGYLYLGQKQSALTAFLLNGLFIAASYHFFERGHIAAGVIFTSFEAGWYFGGIYGAGEEAKFYNERVYERNVTPMMNQKGLFPVLMLQHAF